MRKNKMVPIDIEAEKAVIGAILEDNELIPELDFLIPESFYNAGHQKIYLAIKNTLCPDEITVGDALKSMNQLVECGGYGYLAELKEYAPATGNIIFYGRIIQEHYKSRKIIRLAEETKRQAADSETDNEKLLIDFEKYVDEIIGLNNTETETHEIKEL